jgi:hypothetical protein
VRLYVSHDNAHYRLFAPACVSESVVQRPRYNWSPAGKQPAGGEERVRILELDGIDFEGGYLAVEFPAAEVAGRFGNQRYLLAEASNVPLRLSQRVNGTDFKNGGFDFYDNGASAGWSDCSEGVELRQAFPAGSTLGIRLGCDAKHDKMPDPAFAQVRQFWLHNWVQRAIESGADGVDVRIAFHTRSDEWLAYAFAEPVLAEFRTQCGRDPEPCHDDYGRIRRIRGGFHTQFLRAAKELLGAAGKRLEAHVEARMKTPPEHDTYAHLHWDYATWIDEGIVDGVNLKYLGPYNPFVQQHILPRARLQGIPVHMIGAIGDPRTQPRTPEWAAESLALVQSAGLNGLNLYELWVYLRTTPRGELFYRGNSRSIFTALQQQLAL